jgi:hypothetical protein
LPDYKPLGFVPLSEPQIIGNCEVRACNGAGLVVGTVDLDDNEDLNPCTIDTCSNTVPSSPIHTVAPGLPMCGGGAACTAAGICAGCGVPADCPGGSCRTALCNVNNECGFQPGPLLTPQTAGDCAVILCDASGHDISIPEDVDVPPGACLRCSDGEVVARSGDPCLLPGNQPGLCAPDATCVQCLRDADCPDPGPCALSACSAANLCSQTPAPAGTIAPIEFQTAGDCNVMVCDGAGQMIDEALSADVPALDPSTPCVSRSCSAGGAEVLEYLPAGQPCGGSSVCDGTGSCG